jgi:hypothetical protein
MFSYNYQLLLALRSTCNRKIGAPELPCDAGNTLLVVARTRGARPLCGCASHRLSRERGTKVTNTREGFQLELQDQAASDVAASPSMIDIFTGEDGLVGIDAVVPWPVAAEMVEVAGGLGLTGCELFQPDPDGPTSLQAQVPPTALAATLAPAERAGVMIRDDRDVAQPRNGGSE